MYLDAQDLIAIATGPPGQGGAILKNLDAEIVSLKRAVSTMKCYYACAKQLKYS